jgi:hypothetical protein
MTAGAALADVSAETLPEPSGPGSVVLDIGGEVGAAAIYVSPTLADVEIEIRSVFDDWAGVHVAVRERALANGTIWAALFPALVEGRYEIRVRHGEPCAPTGEVSVIGGQVTTLEWMVV